MKYLDEYHDADAVRHLAEKIKAICKRQWNIMEVCGGQTHAIMRHGLDQLLPENINLLHGPGCPVCVTPAGIIDRAIELSLKPDLILCSFGDMLRVPGSRSSLYDARADGADVRIVYSPADALKLALASPDKQVVFFGIGFETSAPSIALTILQAEQTGTKNFSVLPAMVRIPPAMESILKSNDNMVQGFLAAGHVCAVTGEEEYKLMSERYHIPIVITGFEPLDIMLGVMHLINALERDQNTVINQYARAVRNNGNPKAKGAMNEVFKTCDRAWRGFGMIPDSGLTICDRYADFNAVDRFDLKDISSEIENECISGEILRGIKKPYNCPCFANGCNPEKPMGATMVSSEGACHAYYNYRKSAMTIVRE